MLTALRALLSQQSCKLPDAALDYACKRETLHKMRLSETADELACTR